MGILNAVDGRTLNFWLNARHSKKEHAQRATKTDMRHDGGQ
jgi:hypothetical protein